jgi:hypothetical protein
VTAGHRRLAVLAFSALTLLALDACGRRGNPVPPEVRVPQAVHDLTARERASGVELAWTVPTRRIDNSRLVEPGVTRLYRLEDAGAGEPRPAMLVKDRIPGYTEIEVFRLQDPPSTYVQNGRIVYVDRRGLEYGRRYTYVVTTTDVLGRTSPPSARVSLTYIAAPEPPQALAAESRDRGARITWQPPARLVDGSPVRDPLAYEVLRTTDATAEGAVVARTAAGETSFEDRGLENDRVYYYTVRAVRAAGPDSATGEAGGQVAVTPAKTTPPSPPTDLVAVPSRGEVRLAWRPNPEPDVATYVVYRATGRAAPERIGAVRPPATTFIDRDVRPGTYRYTVTAQDSTARANESRPSNEITVTVP